MNCRSDISAILLALTMTVLSACSATPAPAATDSSHLAAPQVLDQWSIQSSAQAQQSGHIISSTNFKPTHWYHASARSTVMAALLADHKYNDIFAGQALRKVGHKHFAIPWWYRTQFTASPAPGTHMFLRINGVIPGADVWLNGKQIASHDKVAGAYATYRIDITSGIHVGTNTLAFKVYPASTWRDLISSWIDWNPAAPDNNMGLWRDVSLQRTGAVSLRDMHVMTKVTLPGLSHAMLTVKATLENNTDNTQTVTLKGHVANASLTRTITLKPHASMPVTFSPKTNPALAIDHPRIWWPVGMGAHPLYQATLQADVHGQVSDHAQTHFGIRSVTSHLTKQGYRQFVINGKPLLIRGGGWAPDMFLRDDPARLRQAFARIRNLGLNTIRLEGKLAHPDLFRLADREGILVLAGWECCSKWEAAAKTGGAPWNARDMRIALRSMRSEARHLRNHPSVIAFLIGSDNAPPPALSKAYNKVLEATDWPNPVIAAASAQSTAVVGASGMKMSGPYGWVPPDYWYSDKAGGAFGFNSETSADADIPTLDTVRRMLTPTAQAALWQCPNCLQFHASPSWSPFATLKLFDRALTARYGKPTGLADYVAKAQLANYANVRAQFEAYAARMNATNPATGVIYWMLNSAWPSLHWHLFTYGQEPAGAYYGAQKANEPLHIQYDPTTRTVTLANHTAQSHVDLSASIRVRDLAGKVVYRHTLDKLAAAANHAASIFTLPVSALPDALHFVELELHDGTGLVSRNVYWLPAQADVIGWTKSNWYTVPVTRFADLKPLQSLPMATLTASATVMHHGKNDDEVTVTLRNPAKSAGVALLTHVSLRNGGTDPASVNPVYWNHNDVTLWPGETVTLKAHYPVTAVTQGAALSVAVSGWHVQPVLVTLQPTAADHE